jgi:hypothetical protein
MISQELPKDGIDGTVAVEIHTGHSHIKAIVDSQGVSKDISVSEIDISEVDPRWQVSQLNRLHELASTSGSVVLGGEYPCYGQAPGNDRVEGLIEAAHGDHVPNLVSATTQELLAYGAATRHDLPGERVGALILGKYVGADIVMRYEGGEYETLPTDSEEYPHNFASRSLIYGGRHEEFCLVASLPPTHGEADKLPVYACHLLEQRWLAYLTSSYNYPEKLADLPSDDPLWRLAGRAMLSILSGMKEFEGADAVVVGGDTATRLGNAQLSELVDESLADERAARTGAQGSHLPEIRILNTDEETQLMVAGAYALARSYQVVPSE